MEYDDGEFTRRKSWWSDSADTGMVEEPNSESSAWVDRGVMCVSESVC